MKRLIPLSVIMMCALLIGLGCGDDETTTITEYDTVIQTVTVYDTSLSPVMAVGAITPQDGLYFTSAMYYPTSNRPTPDSVVVADSLCDLWVSADWGVWTYSNVYWLASFNTGALIVQPGDTAEIRYYVNGQTSTARVKTLHPQFEPPMFVDSEIPDTILVDDPLTLIWSKCTPADWYRLTMYHYTNTDYQNIIVSTVDTTYTIPGDMNSEDGWYDFYIIAMTGPEPGNLDGNITGGLVRGSIFSFTDQDYVGVRVGTGTALRTAGTRSAEPFSPEQIADELLKTYHLITPAGEK